MKLPTNSEEFLQWCLVAQNDQHDTREVVFWLQNHGKQFADNLSKVNRFATLDVYLNGVRLVRMHKEIEIMADANTPESDSNPNNVWVRTALHILKRITS